MKKKNILLGLVCLLGLASTSTNLFSIRVREELARKKIEAERRRREAAQREWEQHIAATRAPVVRPEVRVSAEAQRRIADFTARYNRAMRLREDLARKDALMRLYLDIRVEKIRRFTPGQQGEVRRLLGRIVEALAPLEHVRPPLPPRDIPPAPGVVPPPVLRGPAVPPALPAPPVRRRAVPREAPVLREAPVPGEVVRREVTVRRVRPEVARIVEVPRVVPAPPAAPPPPPVVAPPVPPAPPAVGAPPAPPGLLEEIRAGRRLRPVGERPVARPTAEEEGIWGQLAAQIARRRQAIAGE